MWDFGKQNAGTELLAMKDFEVEKKLFRKLPGSISTVLDGETVILDVESGIYSGLNEVGTVVWNMLENQVTFATLHDTILSEFDVTAEECFEHLQSFLKELSDNKLIEVRGEASS